eukprot:5338696-Pleurochrysis_carterae.AAC.2
MLQANSVEACACYQRNSVATVRHNLAEYRALHAALFERARRGGAEANRQVGPDRRAQFAQGARRSDPAAQGSVALFGAGVTSTRATEAAVQFAVPSRKRAGTCG